MKIFGAKDEDFPYPLGDFPPATLLDWALLGDEGNIVSIEDTPQKVNVEGSF
jgi:hypothetical protein